ncbi:hypothetical protein SLEP1_g34118 [Rubroshorea leprosula]|uniref:Retrovirus-related Pol polyprotein from transposon RE2 n=1 Tax=Rubroshorea leprosula TaxID=152421 RepID=A0AAV5KIR7_9ROSI|nr:hypothetical protein SLEP1_g34118 [Rubroshorea leprosula]
MHEAKPMPTPLVASTSLHLGSGSPLFDGSSYWRLLGFMQYLALTCPDLYFAVNKLSQFMHQPTDAHWQLAKRVLCYLQGTDFHGLLLRPQLALSLHAYSDADWASNHSNCVSTTDYLVVQGSNPISWHTTKQKAVAWSSTKVEYHALASTASELVWVHNLLLELGVSGIGSLALFCDNIGATYLSLNPVLHSCMKHIAVDLHFVRDLVNQKILHVSHISSHDQLADSLTKALSTSHFSSLHSKIGVANNTSILRGLSKHLYDFSHGGSFNAAFLNA